MQYCKDSEDINNNLASSTCYFDAAQTTEVAFAASLHLSLYRNSLLQEIENEDKHRKWYYDQLEALEQKIHSLPMTDNYNLQADMTRRQLESDIQCIQEVMSGNLGTSEQISLRHEARIQRIRMIENEMIQLQQRHRQQLEEEKGLSCSHVSTTQDGSMVLDVPDDSNVASEVSFVEASYHELQGDLPDGTLLYNGPNGSRLVTIATQTADQLFPFEAGAQQLETEGARPSSNQNLASLYHGAWPIDNGGHATEGSLAALANQDTASVMSFHSNNTSSTSFSHVAQQQLGTKVEMVYSLLSMLGTHDKDDMSRTLLAMSSSQDSCIAMRQSGCLPLLIQLLHGSDKDSGLLGNTRGSKAARARAAAALHNVVHSHPDDKRGRREARVLRLLEQIRAHCDQLRGSSDEEEDNGKKSRPGSGSADIDHHPGPAIAALMKLSFDEEHRHAICTLGGLQAIAELLQLDHEINSNTIEQYNITMRRYACMALTNLTFGDGTNKALLCSMKSSMRALVSQLLSTNEDLRQVAASVLRNLSWRADLASKKTLREVGSVTSLTIAAMEVSKESTLKSILSALWNLSAHCSENKADICAVEGALAFLVTSLTFKSPSKTLSIIENGGGILRNVSSHIAVREDYRKVLRNHNCLQILLKHLRSPSLTVVSNACGTLWNLSARCQEDQKALWEMGAVSMLRNLVHSKHKMISMGSTAALKNLLSARPNLGHIEGDQLMPTNRPGLHVRKRRALEAEIDQNLAETCENLESPTGSPTETRKSDPVKHKFVLNGDGQNGFQTMDAENRRLHMRNSMYGRGCSADNSPLVEHRLNSPQRGVSRSGSQDSVGSTHSDISHDRGRMHKNNRFITPEGLDTKTVAKSETSPRGSSDRTSSSSHSGSGSRIVQAMQEVAHHAGIENNTDRAYNRDSVPKTTNDVTRGQQGSSNHEHGRIPVYKGQSFHRNKDSNEYASKANGNSENQMSHSAEMVNLSYSSRTQRMERLHLNLPEPEQDEPINYSMKYPSEPQRAANQQKQPSAFARPMPKVQNYVGGQFQRYGVQPQNGVSGHTQNFESEKDSPPKDYGNTKGKKSHSQCSNGYAETDLDHDNIDQPTDFSLRFGEPDEDHQRTDQPINYSKQFREPAENRVENNMRQPMMSLDEDTVRTFCTEGTPLTYLSTATSMSDLSGKGEKEEALQQKLKQSGTQSIADQSKNTCYPESEMMSGTGTHSTERNTSSTVTVKNSQIQVTNQSKLDVPNMSPPGDNSQPPSMYSYNDSTNTSSPSDKPRAYATEGTPVSFSRRSSLSSLQSADVQDNQKDLHSADDSLDASLNADVTIKAAHEDDSFQSANTSDNSNAGHTKTVTFDENNQVHETPLMFSRCSSLGSLSSFDAHSVHSSVVSEYSRRASEVVSPSELPDSPSDTMPPSPTRRKSPVRFAPEDTVTPLKPEKTEKSEKVDKQKEEKLVKLDTIPEGAALSTVQANICKSQPGFTKDDLLKFAEEGSPKDDFSCATSLSALTFDDEPEIRKDPGLRIVPLGQETDPEPQFIPANLFGTTKEEFRQDEPEKENISIDSEDEDDDDDDNSSVSEGEENLLAECINLAMPSSSKKKMKKSNSDGLLKQKSEDSLQVKLSASRIPMSVSAGNLSSKNSRIPQATAKPIARLQGIVKKQEDFTDGAESPQKFATEDTPLNYSRTESLSDLSMSSDDINETMNTVIDARTRKKKKVPTATLR